jgi:DNA polymerase-3 subunit alpha
MDMISDINNTSACLNTLRIAEKLGIKVVPVIDFRNGVKQQYIGSIW